MSGKSPDAFRTISEVADWLDRPAHVLRFWESKFNQIKPVKRAGGRRYYRPEDMLLLGGIKKLLHDDGMTIKGAQKVLREQGVRYVTALSQPLDDDSLTPSFDAVPVVAAPVAVPDAATPRVAHVPEEASIAAGEAAETWDADAAELAAGPATVTQIPRGPQHPPAVSPAPADRPQADEADRPQADAPAEPSPAAEPVPMPAAAAPAPLGADLPPPPDLAAIQPAPGILAAIAARRAPFPPADRAAVTPILARLEDMVTRMSAARRG